METVVHLQTPKPMYFFPASVPKQKLFSYIAGGFLNFAVAKRRPAEGRATIPRSLLKQTACPTTCDSESSSGFPSYKQEKNLTH